MNHVKVLFQIENDEEGYPGIEAESVWGQTVSNDLVKIDNIPFYTYDATFGDIVAVSQVEGTNYFKELISPSTNSLLRVVVYDESILSHIRDQLRLAGCDSELSHDKTLFSLNVPDSVSLMSARRILEEAHLKDLLDYEEAILRQADTPT